MLEQFRETLIGNTWKRMVFALDTLYVTLVVLGYSYMSPELHSVPPKQKIKHCSPRIEIDCTNSVLEDHKCASAAIIDQFISPVVHARYPELDSAN